MFKDVASRSDIVLLVQVEKKKGEPGTLNVVEVFKGTFEYQTLYLNLAEIGPARIKDRDHLFLALTKNGRLVRHVPGMGACAAISAVAIRGGKLRPRDRLGYDSRRETLSLEELRIEMVYHLGGH